MKLIKNNNMNNKDFIDYLETQMNYYKSFDRDMYIHYRNKLKLLTTKK